MNRRAEHVVLINPPSPWLISDRDLPPLGILALGASLRWHGVSVEVCDLAGQEDWQIPAGDLYGIGFTTPQYGIVKRIAAVLSQDPDCRIVLGGPHCSALPRRTWGELQCDVVFTGEADWALADFALGRPAEEIPGVVFQGPHGEWVHNPLPVVPVHLLPFPARDMIDIDDYHRIDTFSYVGGTREGYVQTGRGCPYNCAFCGQRCVTGGHVRYRTVQQVVDEVRTLALRYGCDQIYFEDDTFNLDSRRVGKLCDALKELNIAWHCLLRGDRLTPPMAQQMYEAGCRAVVFGFESGSDEMLRRMHKGFTIEQALRAADVASSAGMHVRAQMIVGFPGETDETVAETLEFVWRASVDKWGFHIFAPLPGSPAWESPERYGLEIDKEAVDWEHGFTTIGRPGEWDETHIRARKWLEQLNAATKGRNIWEGMAT